jgi:hypothetical protein
MGDSSVGMTNKKFEELGAQYRDVKHAIGSHRTKQAQAEVTYAAASHARIRRGDLEPSAEERAALEDVEQAVADVAWCQACTVAAGEAFTGRTFEELAAHDRAEQMARIAATEQSFAEG